MASLIRIDRDGNCTCMKCQSMNAQAKEGVLETSLDYPAIAASAPFYLLLLVMGALIGL